MKMLKSKKGNVVLYITFIISAIVIILVASVFAPMGVALNTHAYTIGEDLMLYGNETSKQIVDTDVRESIQDSIGDSLSNIDYTIELNTNIFKYSWIFVIVLTALILFLFQRRLVELGGGGGII